MSGWSANHEATRLRADKTEPFIESVGIGSAEQPADASKLGMRYDCFHEPNTKSAPAMLGHNEDVRKEALASKVG